MAQAPIVRKRVARRLPCLEGLGDIQHNRYDQLKRYPGQGSLCSQVISRKGSLLPSEEEYLRAGSRAV